LLAGDGEAFVFSRSGVAWTEQATITANDSASYFGVDLAISAATILVGAPETDVAGVSHAGAAYVFVKHGAVWTQQAKLIAPTANVSDDFGLVVALSGDTALVGCQYDDNVAGTNAGAAYVYSRAGTTWSQQAKLVAPDAVPDQGFGDDVGIDGDT